MTKDSSKLNQFWNGLKYDFKKLSERVNNLWVDFLFLIKIKKYDHSNSFDEYISSQLDEIIKQYYDLKYLCLHSVDLKELSQIIETHTKCIIEDLCMICEIAESKIPNSMYPWLLLAQNPNMNFKLHEKLFSLIGAWQGMQSDYLFNLLENPKLDKKTRKIILEDTNLLVRQGVHEEDILQFFNKMLHHKSFQQDELHQFLIESDEYQFFDEMTKLFKLKFPKEEFK